MLRLQKPSCNSVDVALVSVLRNKIVYRDLIHAGLEFTRLHSKMRNGTALIISTIIYAMITFTTDRTVNGR